METQFALHDNGLRSEIVFERSLPTAKLFSMPTVDIYSHGQKKVKPKFSIKSFEEIRGKVWHKVDIGFILEGLV